ncbi:hypothetical protein M378DRAFT_196346 [Amanita muscaria Koide BX008]|uniref:Uncharacterized protein n=1 Tax=Amanita muscaria (strain Koide BX008) TaxID=946122 RepID=A0A0C2TMG0_AMAMK|nr:hypothetical protein M378DRAFT_196346 [Amanita muscaria Koide BX008]
MAAKEFSLEEAVVAFGLQFKDDFSVSRPPYWNVEEIAETKGFEPSPCLTPLMESYSCNFDRTSEAGCRTAVDFILNECLTAMRSQKRNTSPPSSTSQSSIGSRAKSDDQTTDERSMRTPPPFQDIKVFGGVSFSHKINATKGALFWGVTVNGRVDHGIGRTITSFRHSGKRNFQSLLLLVEAKTKGSIDEALAQLVVYLGSLHQSRLSRHRSDASVYGVASDGYLFTFVTITHEGVLKRSKQFNIMEHPEDLVTVLGCLKYLLEKSASITPNLIPKRNGGHALDGDGDEDPAFDLDDNEFMHPPPDDD